MPQRVLSSLLLLPLLWGLAGAQTVSTASQLRSALVTSSGGSINITRSISLAAWPTPVKISGPINVTGNPGVVLDFGSAPGILIDVAGGHLVFSNITIANFTVPGAASNQGPVPGISVSSGGSLLYDHVLFHCSSGNKSLALIPYWAQHANPTTLLAQGDGGHSASQAWMLDSWQLDSTNQSISVVNSTLVQDVSQCFSGGGTAVAYDSATLRQALAYEGVSSILVLQNITLDPARFTVRQPLVLSRPVTLGQCPGAVLSLNELGACIVVTTGGRLGFQPGFWIAGTKALLRSYWPTANSLLLSAVDINGSGAVVLQDVNLLTSTSINTQDVINAYPASARPQYQALDPNTPNHLRVEKWNLTQQMFQQYIAPIQVDPANNILQSSRLQSRRLLQEPAAAAATSRLRHLQAGAGALEVAAAAAAAGRRQLQAAAADDGPASNSYWLLQNVTQQKVDYAGGSCFSDFEGFVANDIVQFKRLLLDPAATHIELKGNIIFDDDNFPPENANDKKKGLNITHKVEIRACTGDLDNAIIVDINNLQQQIYVFGFMRWHGNIKFINSYPSPRRAGLFPLISVLSVEEDGVIEFEDLQIHGNEPCPLFNDQDPFWEQYVRDPDFVPRPGDFVRLRDNALLLLDWRFIKSAWVRRSQGKTGVVAATGNGYWSWVNVLVTWSPSSKTAGAASGPMLAAIIVPVVLGSLAIIAAIVGFLWLRRRKRAAGKAGAREGQEGNALGNSMTGSGIGNSRHNEGTFDSAGSRLDVTKSTTGTHELIEEARRRMQAAATGKRDASIILEGLLGEGTFGKVYRGHWQGTLVAVKTMLFPAAMSGKEKREKMAIMETAISSSLSHPNVVQTYTYVVKPLTGELAAQAMEMGPQSVMPPDALDATDTSLEADPQGDHGWEVRLVLELCDRGSLKELLSAGGLLLQDRRPNMVAVIATALDVARAMLHLHTENIVHSDLKARNVLLKSAGSDARGFVAKVSDFGLSVRMDPTETHVSNVYQGTLTHMAPEVLMHGKISRASDVYAFGILLWELYTGEQAFKGTPRVLLGHEVTKLGRRPEFPPDCPFDYQLLACRCWESDPGIRPSFQQILADLQRMASKLSSPSPDSASSLPIPCSSTSASRSGGPIPAMRAPSGSDGRPGLPLLDPAKLHNWEPQTSLLDLNSMSASQAEASTDAYGGGLTAAGSSTVPPQQQQPQAWQQQQQQQGGKQPSESLSQLWRQQQYQRQQQQAAAQGQQQQQAAAQQSMWPAGPAAAAAAAADAAMAAGACAGAAAIPSHGDAAAGGAAAGTGSSQAPPQSMSWGDQSGGGFWLGGDFAPSNLSSDMQLPNMHGSDDPFAAAAAGGAHASMAVQEQKHQHHHEQQPVPHNVSSPSHHHHQQLWQQQHLQHHGFADDPSEPGSSSGGTYAQDSLSTLSSDQIALEGEHPHLLQRSMLPIVEDDAENGGTD